MVPMRTMEQRDMFGARIKIMWEEQLVDPPIDYITNITKSKAGIFIRMNNFNINILICYH